MGRNPYLDRLRFSFCLFHGWYFTTFTTMCQAPPNQPSKERPCIPMSEARGFTGGFDNYTAFLRIGGIFVLP